VLENKAAKKAFSEPKDFAKGYYRKISYSFHRLKKQPGKIQLFKERPASGR